MRVAIRKGSSIPLWGVALLFMGACDGGAGTAAGSSSGGASGATWRDVVTVDYTCCCGDAACVCGVGVCDDSSGNGGSGGVTHPTSGGASVEPANGGASCRPPEASGGGNGGAATGADGGAVDGGTTSGGADGGTTPPESSRCDDPDAPAPGLRTSCSCGSVCVADVCECAADARCMSGMQCVTDCNSRIIGGIGGFALRACLSDCSTRYCDVMDRVWDFVSCIGEVCSTACGD